MEEEEEEEEVNDSSNIEENESGQSQVENMEENGIETVNRNSFI